MEGPSEAAHRTNPSRSIAQTLMKNSEANYAHTNTQTPPKIQMRSLERRSNLHLFAVLVFGWAGVVFSHASQQVSRRTNALLVESRHESRRKYVFIIFRCKYFYRTQSIQYASGQIECDTHRPSGKSGPPGLYAGRVI